MGLSIWFWFFMAILVLFRGWHGYRAGEPGIYVWGGGLIEFILFLILGWAQFGSPIK